jgi:hypothetical protein
MGSLFFRDAENNESILRINCGEKFDFAKKPTYFHRKFCGECTSMNIPSGLRSPGITKNW